MTGKSKTIFLTLSTLILLEGCVTKSEKKIVKEPQVVGSREKVLDQAIDECDLSSIFSENVKKPSNTCANKISTTFFTHNASVNEWLHFFKKRGKKTVAHWLNIGETAKTVIYPILKQEGVPKEIFFIAMIESGFNVKATSPHKACGPWQLIAGTARRYGLKVTKTVDERRDLVKSTQAAVRYFKDLYAQFGDWQLAMAAYNAGPGNIAKAIKKAKTTDYWQLVKTPYLKKEVKEFLPKVIALALIGEFPEQHGFYVNKKSDIKLSALETKG